VKKAEKKNGTNGHAWRSRVVGFTEKPANQFTANAFNFRRHPVPQREAFRGLVSELGFAGAVLENKRTGNLIDGHLRIEEALSVDEHMMIPCVQVDLSEAEERLLLASYDPLSAMAEADKETLDLLLRDVSTGDAAVSEMLSKLAESEGLYFGEEKKQEDEETVAELVDRAAELQKKWKTKPGQLWQIGAHRLLIGDCTEKANVGRLWAGKRPSLIATDPPYGVNYVEKARDMHRSGYGHSHSAMNEDIESDELKGEALVSFLVSALEPALEIAADKCAVYVWHQDARRREFTEALDRLGVFIHQIIVWLKPGFVIGRCNYHHRFEPCFHGWPKGKRPEFFGARNQTNVWEVGRENDKVHPTQKPVELFVHPILNHTRKGEPVYEPFAGSGTQYVAAEQEGRVCYGMEKDPRYAGVVCERLSLLGLEVKKLDG
jgi:DNA modification methylase